MRRVRILAASLLVACATAAHGSETELVQFGASGWRYLDGGQPPPAAWIQQGFDDSGWNVGPAPLGYGEGDEGTVVSFGSDPNQKHITTWLRKTFTVSNPSAIASLDLRIDRDDAALVYLNGVEVARSNLPAGGILPTTLASSTIGTGVEGTLVEYAVDPARLVSGTNTLAVEVHQAGPNSSDLRLDLELVATDTTPVSVTRGPYLQLATDHSVRIRWRTDVPHPTRLRYGRMLTALTGQADDATPKTEHEVVLNGLSSARRYHYAVGTSSSILAGGDGLHTIDVSPATGAPARATIWVLGDPGGGNTAVRNVRDRFLSWNGGQPDLVLMLGDNAYLDGTDAEFQTKLFDIFPSTLRQVTLWPTFGNHDAVSSTASTETGPYFDAFSLPRNGEAGGIASGTEAYYAFDYGDIHFIVMDSQGSPRHLGGPMMSWLAADLAANQSRFTIAYWHHPPYSKGSHDSDTSPAETTFRENALPILEAGGVDLVLSGHSHSYERSVLLDGHYDTSDTLTSGMVLDPGDGDPAGDGAYMKNASSDEPNEGAVYLVLGSSAFVHPGPLDHPAMYTSQGVLGSVAVRTDGAALDVTLISDSGAVLDEFRIQKRSGCLNGIDEDGDGATDGADPDCALPGALSEFPVCADGIDNDGDGATDLADPGCGGPGTTEAPACQDGIDNDGDGFIDHDGAGGAGNPDPQCTAPWIAREAPRRTCGLGAELVLLLPIAVALRRRRLRTRRSLTGLLVMLGLATTLAPSADAAVFNVVNFGADPVSFSNLDAAAANAAVDAACAAGGGEVHFPAGFYRLGRVHGAGGAFYSGLQIDCDNIEVTGVGDASVLMPANTGGQTVIAMCAAFTGTFGDHDCDFTSPLHDIAVRDLKIWDDDPLGHCVTNAGGTVCVSEESHGITARNVQGLVIERVTLESLGDESITIGGDSSDAFVRDSVFLDCPSVHSPGSCLELDWGHDYDVRNNTFEGGIGGSIIDIANHGANHPVSDVVISSNVLREPDFGGNLVNAGIQIEPNLSKISRVTITGNTIDVDRLLRPAIETVTTQHQIEDLTISFNYVIGTVDLRSNTNRRLVVENTLVTSQRSHPDDPALTIGGQDIRIEGNTFDGHKGGCIEIWGSNGSTRDVTLTGNTCRTNSDNTASEPAISMIDTSCDPNDGVDGTLSVTHNWIEPPPTGSIAAAIKLSDCGAGEVLWNTINVGSTSTTHGITGGKVLRQNVMTGVVSDGIRTGASGAVIRANTIDANRCVALVSTSSADVWFNDFTACNGIVETNGATSTSCYDNDDEPAPCSRILACQDGFDNDGDGLTDGADKNCSSNPASEAGGPGCGLGPELLPLLGLFRLARSRRSWFRR